LVFLVRIDFEQALLSLRNFARDPDGPWSSSLWIGKNLKIRFSFFLNFLLYWKKVIFHKMIFIEGLMDKKKFDGIPIWVEVY